VGSFSVIPKWVVEVKYHSKDENGRLVFPTLLQFRGDLTPEDLL